MPHRDFTFIEEAREIKFGDWEGLTFDEINESHANLVKDWMNDENFCFPNGESLPAFNKRIGRLAKSLTADFTSNKLLVTHGEIIRHLICHFLGLSPRQSVLFQINTPSVTRLKSSRLTR